MEMLRACQAMGQQLFLVWGGYIGGPSPSPDNQDKILLIKQTGRDTNKDPAEDSAHANDVLEWLKSTQQFER